MNEPTNTLNEDSEPQMTVTVANRDRFFETYQQMIEERRSYLTRLQSQTAQMCGVNEHAAAFYEKLALLDGGTIALSLTFLGSLLSRPASYHLPKGIFSSLVCPAWVLLLLSVFHCWNRISGFLNINASLVQQMCIMSDSFHHLWLGLLVKRMSGLVKGELKMGAETQDLSELFSKMGEVLTKGDGESQKLNALIEHAAQVGKSTSFSARAASIFTTVALMLLCIFAIVVFLRA